jgi:methionine-rich copper-binding protein CopC
MSATSSAYAAAHAVLQVARTEADELAANGAPAAARLEARDRVEQAKARLAAARAAVSNAAWSEGRLADAPHLGRAVEALLADVLADARSAQATTG